MSDKILTCPGCPCHGCPRENTKSGCSRNGTAGARDPGCPKFMAWAREGFGNQHRQGMESIRERDAKMNTRGDSK
jgi:hypothetical protein